MFLQVQYLMTAGMHCQPECFALSCGMSMHSL